MALLSVEGRVLEGQLQPNKILYVLNLKPKCSIRIQIIGPSGMESKLLDGLL